MTSSLEHLHLQFNQAITNHTYLDQSESQSLESTNKKNIRLKEVFDLACTEIKESLKTSQNLDNLKERISQLRLLEIDGQSFYTRYEKATNTWRRWICKGIAYYTPKYFKIFLPKCFSNRMAEAEQQTKEAYETYCQLIKERIYELSQKQKNNDFPDPSFDCSLDKIEHNFTKGPENKKEGLKPKERQHKEDDPFMGYLSEEDRVLQEILATHYALDKKTPSNPTKNTHFKEQEEEISTIPIDYPQPQKKSSSVEIEKEKQNNLLISHFNFLKSQVIFFNAFAKKLSKQKCKSLITLIVNSLQSIKKTTPQLDQNSILKETGLTENCLNILQNTELAAALNSQNDDTFLTLFKSTDWETALTESWKQQECITFGVQTIAQEIIIKLMNEKGPVKLDALNNYKGSIHLILANIKSPIEFRELLNILKTEETACHPSTIEIQFSEDQTLTLELLQLLLSLSQHVADIQIKGLQTINFKGMEISEEEDQFISQLKRFNFPDLKSIVLSTASKEKWSALDWTNLLHVCPTLEVFEQCYSLSSSYSEEIIIPLQLQQSVTSLNGGTYPLEKISYLMTCFPLLSSLDLRNTSLTNQQLIDWINKGDFNQLKNLQLDGCSKLTAEIFYHLPKLTQLTQLSLPDIPLPKQPLDIRRLPKLDNPFKIKLFYTSAKATQHLATDLYTGPIIWASLFQILLARQKVDHIFKNDHNALDPKSVAYWLYQQDYQNLSPQTSIKTIIADSNALLNDENLVEFIQKFPKASTLSLYNCLNVTEAGIIRMLQACPSIKKLDLTDCQQITENLFYGDHHDVTLLRLNKITISGTAISPTLVQSIKEKFGIKIIFDNTILNITNEQLTDKDALERLLQTQDLTKIKRINFKDCPSLTNEMLSCVLDRLNVDVRIETKEKTYIDNPQRLNLAVLDLTNCENITDEAFDGATEDGKITPKILNTLNRVIIGGTKISETLLQLKPNVLFQNIDQPVTLQINPDTQLIFYKTYFKVKRTQKFLSSQLINHRIVVELFGAKCQNQQILAQILQEPMDTNSKEFCDFCLSFSTDTSEPALFPIHKDLLYVQSSYFMQRLRTGEKIPGINVINQHATTNAAKVVIDLFYGNCKIENLDWKTAADAAELIGPKNFKLSNSLYQALLLRFHTQFDLAKADEMLKHVKMLNDKVALNEFDNTLVALYQSCIDNLSLYEKEVKRTIDLAEFYLIQPCMEVIMNLAKSHPLPKSNILIQDFERERDQKMVAYFYKYDNTF